MPSGTNDSSYLQPKKKDLWQGDILRGISFQYATPEGDGQGRYAFPFPYAVILSQACDLEQHFAQARSNEAAARDASGVVEKFDKILETILVCPAFPSEAFLNGTHIENRRMNDFDNAQGRKSTLKKLEANDSLNRYHYLSPFEGIFPALVIDFKRFHTVPVEILIEEYESTYLASLRELFRERLSQRFSNYLSRIGLPGDARNGD